MSKQIKELRSLLEGKTIQKIKDSKAPESICTFVMSDGSSFRLHATDLGFWIEETCNYNGRYSSLNALITDYGNHVMHLTNEYNRSINIKYDYNPPDGAYYLALDAKIIIDSDNCKFIAPDGKEFIGNLSKFSNYERKILLHSKGQKILAEWAVMGNYWTMMFNNSNKDCPEELYFQNNITQ